MNIQKNCAYPGGWKLTDHGCMQYVRRCGPGSYQWIKYSPMTQDGTLYEVYTDNVCLRDYEDCEIEEIIQCFGYDSLSALYGQHPCRDEANQVIAGCIFQHCRSSSAQSLRSAVSKAFAEKTIHEYLLLHYTAPRFQKIVELSVEELVCKMVNLQHEEALNFFECEDGDMYGAVKVRHFNTSMLFIDRYGGFAPLALALNEDMDSDMPNAQVLERFKAYCEANRMNRLHICLERKEGTLCQEATEMRDRKKNALFSKGALMKQLSEGGYTDRALSTIRDEYIEALGFDPVWRYPFCHDGKLGAVLIPVKEGFLWLPYSTVDIEDNEKYEPENTALLDAKTCEWLITEMERHTEPLAAVMRYVADELKEAEKLRMVENVVA